MAYLDLKNVSKTFSTIVAVNGFTLEITKGKLVSFLGPSGCGKTTTLRMIAGFEQPDTGTIMLDGKDVTDIPPNQRDIGMVFQSYALFPNMTIRENVAFGLQMRKKSKEEIDKRLNEVLDLVRLQNAAKRFPHQLSGGQQQRVALARAIAIKPRVLLLDEPLSALDAEVRVALRGEIRRIQSELAITTVYVTHDQEEALSISDTVVVMDKGIIQQVGTPMEIYRAPRNRFVATFIGTANQFFGRNYGNGNVECENFHLLTGELKEYSKDQQVVVLVRPENISIHTEKPEQPGMNNLQGIVETITFHGAVTRIGLNVHGQRIVADTTVSSNKAIILNQQVWLLFPPGACQVMPVNE